MTALPVPNDTPGTGMMTASGPLHRFFTQTRLADMPETAHNLQFDTDVQPRGTKTLMSFTADVADVMLFVAMSPAIRQAEPERYSEKFHLVADSADSPAKMTGGEDPCRRIPDEPDFPWWRPELVGHGRRYAYDTPDFDFIEIILDDERGEVFIRAIK